MPKSWCVYKHTNKENKKVYIGITSQSTIRRWDGGRGYVGNKHFYNSICKYGWENFNHEIILNNLSKESACMQERLLIKQYGCNEESKGYNIACGGEGIGTVSKETREKMSLKKIGNTYKKGFKLSDESKKKMSESHKGKTFTESHKNSLSESYNRDKEVIAKRTAHSKGNNYKLGKKDSEETKKKKSDWRKISQFGSNNSNARKVICLTTNKIFGSVVEAGKYCNLISVARISDVCKGKIKSAGKKDNKRLVWMYYEDFINNTKEGDFYRGT